MVQWWGEGESGGVPHCASFQPRTGRIHAVKKAGTYASLRSSNQRLSPITNLYREPRMFACPECE